MIAPDLNALYPAEALAQQLSVPDFGRQITVTPDELLRFARSRNFHVTESDGAAYVERRTLDSLIAQFAAELGVPRRRHAIPDFLRECASPWATTLVRMYEGDLGWPAALPPAQGELLKTLVANIDPTVTVEIGCFIGISSLWMAAALEELGRDGILHSIDLFTEIMPSAHAHHRYHGDPLTYARDAVASASLSHRVHFHKAHSLQAPLVAPQAFQRPIDLLFIDGDHTIEGCASDFLLYAPHVAVGGYILLHDIYPDACGCDGPRWLIDRLVTGSPDFAVLEIPTVPTGYGEARGYGIAIIRKLGPTDQDVHEQRARWLRVIAREPARAFVRAMAKRVGFRPAQGQVTFPESRRLLARFRALAESQRAP